MSIKLSNFPVKINNGNVKLGFLILTPTPLPTLSATPTPTASPSPTPTSSTTPNPTFTPGPTGTPTPSPTITPTETPVPTISPGPTPMTPPPSLSPTPSPTPVGYRYYLWKIYNTRDSLASGEVKASEFAFQYQGADETLDLLDITSEDGINPVGYELTNLVDGDLLTSWADNNIVNTGFGEVLFDFGYARYFTGYRWATSSDSDVADPTDWELWANDGSETWVLLDVVSGFSPGSTREDWQTARLFGTPATPTPTATPLPTDTPEPTPPPTATPSPAIAIYDAANSSSYPGTGATWYNLGTNGSANDGTMVNAFYSSDYGGVMRFNGTDAYVAINQLISGSSYTIEAMIRWDVLFNARNILSTQESPFWISGNDLSAGIANNYQLATYDVSGLSGFTHVTVTYDGDLMKLYINGSNAVTNTVGYYFYESQPTFIGCHSSPGDSDPVSFFSGDISSLYVYNRALGDDEVYADYLVMSAQFNPTPTPPPTPSPTPTPSPSTTPNPTNTPVSMIFSWARNNNGQLGDGTDAGPKLSPGLLVTVVENWKEIHGNANANSLSFGGIKLDSTLWMWGNGFGGMLGLGNNNDRSSPTQILGGGTWAQVSIGEGASAAIKTDGTLWVMGTNSNGCLGLDLSNIFATRNSPTSLGTSGWRSISAGATHFAATKTDNSLWVWGNNNDGRLGDGTKQDRQSPVQIAGSYSSAYAGNRNTAAIKIDGSLWMWGDNEYGQMGNNSVVSRSSPVQIGTENNWTKVQISRDYAYALRGGDMFSWGRNQAGQLGLNISTHRSSPSQVATNVNFIATGITTGYFVDSNGRLWGMGADDWGQLGRVVNSNILYSSPVQTVLNDTKWLSICGINESVFGIRYVSAPTPSVTSTPIPTPTPSPSPSPTPTPSPSNTPSPSPSNSATPSPTPTPTPTIQAFMVYSTWV